MHETGSTVKEKATGLRLKRFFPFYCLLVAAFTFLFALYDPYRLDGDAVSYMDIADLIRSHCWAGIVNGYWHPLYPACLALGHVLFRSTRTNELHAYYMVNYAIFLLQMVAIVCFTDALSRLRDASAGTEQTWVMDRFLLRYAGLALLVVANQRELSLGRVRPDALLQALLLFAVAALLAHLRTGHNLHAVLMGGALGLAYLTKSFAFLFGVLCIVALVGARWLWKRERPVRALVSGAVAFCCLLAVAGPYIAALSKQKGRFDFGDSGALNYAWYVGGTEKMHLEPWQTEKFGAAAVHLKHPDRQLSATPEIYSYATLPYGTYPDWFDASFFNERIVPRTAFKSEMLRSLRNIVLTLRYVFNHPEPVILLGVLLVFGGVLRFGVRRNANLFWIVPLGLGVMIWVIYGTVNVEERYVTVGYLLMVLTAFAMLATGRRGDAVNLRVTAAAVVATFAVLVAAESLREGLELRRTESVMGRKAGWEHPEWTEAVRGLEQLGVRPGDRVACIGWKACLYDMYWAREAGVRVLTEIYAPDGPAEAYLEAMPNREQALGTVRAQGDKVIVGWFNPARMGRTAATEGWQQLGESHLYALPLNLPDGATVTHASKGPNAPID